MKAVKKIFNFFTGNPKIQTINQIKDLKITGELYKKSIGQNLTVLSKEVLMNFSQDDQSVLEYRLSVINIAPKTERNNLIYFS